MNMKELKTAAEVYAYSLQRARERDEQARAELIEKINAQIQSAANYGTMMCELTYCPALISNLDEILKMYMDAGFVITKAHQTIRISWDQTV
jgi:hypothetical protein